MGAFSKSLSPSLRISYMVLPEKLIKDLSEKLSFIICPVPAIEQKVLCRFIQEGYFERHLNKMRNIYKKKREVLVDNIRSAGRAIEIVGADAGLHLVLRINNGMTEKKLVESALKAGVKVYGLSNYYIRKESISKEPEILLGYAAMREEEIIHAVNILNNAWFGDLIYEGGQERVCI
jgi:GntR family transcriptional regulator/MocR family aminotransferase